MALSPTSGKPRLRRLPLRPSRESRLQRVVAAVTKTEKAKVGKMAKLYNADESELLYFKSVDQLVRQHDQIFPRETETP